MSRALRRKNKKKKLIITLAVEFVVLIGLVGGYAWYYANSKLDQIQTDETPKEEIEVSEAVTDTMEEYRTIALFGLDTREKVDMTKEGVAHSDAVIIASINNKTKEVKMVSIYRDCFLEMATQTPNNTQKFTHAYFLGGPACAMETLNKNLDLNITDYVAVDFEALAKAIDALGGVTINVKSKELNNLNHNIDEQNRKTSIQSEGVWSTGDVLLNGAQATAYARIRKVGNNDFERTQRQRAVITAMVKKAKESNLSTINTVIDEVFPLIATNLSNKELLSLASDLFEYELGENTGFPLSNETPTVGDKGSVVVPANLLSNVEFLHKFLFPEDEEYAPSETVKRISDMITNETGIYDEFTEDKTTEEPTATNTPQS